MTRAGRLRYQAIIQTPTFSQDAVGGPQTTWSTYLTVWGAMAPLSTRWREYAEGVLLRSLMTQTWELCLDAWPQTRYIELPRPPLQEVESFLYVDSEGVEHELDLSDYIVDTRRAPGRIVLPYGGSWPSATLSPDNPIQITYVAGYSSSAAIPGSIKRGILCKVAELYAERGEPVVGSVVTLQAAADRLFGPWRVFRG